MIIVMAAEASVTETDSVVECIERHGGQATVSRGTSRFFVGARGVGVEVGSELTRMSGVATVTEVSAPHELVARTPEIERSTVWVGGMPIGPDSLTLFAGPCAVETHEQTLAAAEMAKTAGATILRGGAYKPRTSPYSFQGLGEEGLRILADVRSETGLPFVTEVIDKSTVEQVASYADMLQIGARNAQNFALLQAVGETGLPVLLKRGLAMTIDEWLLSAEYIAAHGCLDIVLCERGIRTYETRTRNTLDISAVPVVQQLSHLPVIIDPSHSGGHRNLVLPLSRAAVAVGADGLIVDVHPNPATALCDGPQALTDSDLTALAEIMQQWRVVAGRISATDSAIAGIELLDNTPAEYR